MLAPNYSTAQPEAGVDEAGRGPLAGPVVAAAVVLPPGFTHPLLRDSKQLNPEQRAAARALILETAQAWGIGMQGVAGIAQHNILHASIAAMHEAIAQVCQHVTPKRLLIDGNRFKPYPGIEHVTVVKGDGIYAPIAAASILAKTYRDDLMRHLHTEHPQYGWATNKGYPTAAHRAAIRLHGPTPYHRTGFKLF